MKSPRKRSPQQALTALFAAAMLTLPPAFAAQDPPPAPAPKVPADAPAIPGASKAQTAQTPARQQQPSDLENALIVRVNYVFLPVTVKNAQGHLVADLTRDDFRVLDDDVEQRIEFFSGEALPLSVVLLLDNDLKSKDSDQVESSLSAIVAGLSTNDEAAVCRFDSNFHPGKGFTKDQDKLLTELHRTRLDDTRPSVGAPAPDGPFASGPVINGQSVGATGSPPPAPSTLILGSKTTKALDDAVFAAAQLLKDRGRDRRKIILLISDGDNRKDQTNTYNNTVKELLRYGIAVYSVGVGSGYYERKFSRLQSYAKDSGGDTYYAAKRGSLEQLYSRVTEQARNQYTLGYNPHGNNSGKDYHTVEVRVRREGLVILTREGYYSAPGPR